MFNTQTQTTVIKEQKRLIDYLPAAFMLLFLLAGFTMTLFNPSTYKSPTDKSIIKGEWTAAYETQFDESIPFRQFAIDTWGVLEYIAFQEGREGVLVGSEGWLYTNEEFLAYSDAQEAFQNKINLAIKANQQLAEQGINFMVAVIPAKARVYPEYLAEYSYPSYNQTLYTDFITALEEQEIAVVNLLEPLEQAKQINPVFLRTDTHWTTFGANIAAQSIANTVKINNLLASFESTEFQTETLETISHEGDLLSYLPLGSLQASLGPEFDSFEEKLTEKLSSGLGLFSDESIPVTLVGTSYSANPLWHFEGALKQALGADVLNMADEGQGPVIPLEAYLESTELTDNPPELLIWEIPERFIHVSY